MLLSIFFYVCAAVPYTLLYVLITALSVYTGTIWAERKKEYGLPDHAKRIVFIGLLLNMVLWLVLKGNELILLPLRVIPSNRGGAYR